MFRLIAKVVLCVAFLGAADSLDAGVSGWHEPLFGSAGQRIYIKARADDSEGIRKISIIIVAGKMVDCDEVRPWAQEVGVPCRMGASRFIHECEYVDYVPPSTEVACEYSEDFSFSYGGKSLISYRIEATTRSGDVLSDEEITFSQGEAPSQSIARPLWWYRLAPLRSRVDIGFFPDLDYGDNDSAYGNFTADLNSILAGVLFVSAPFAYPFHASRITFNYWAASFGADAEECQRDFASHLDPIISQMDGRVILHQNLFRDCASISLAGYGSVYAKASDASWILAHESGHFLYGQGDEYACDGSHRTVGSCKNIFSSASDCVAYAINWNLRAGECEEMVCNDIPVAWRLGRGNSVMRDRDLLAEWHSANRKCVQDRINTCESGVCYVRSVP